MPLPAGGAGWLVLVFGADVVLDLAGLVVAAELEDAGGVELAGAGVEAGAVVLDALVSAAALVDFLVLAGFVPESALVDAAVSVDEAFADFDFFEVVDFVAAPESVEAVESAFASAEEADFDFLELADFDPDVGSDESAFASVEEAFADFDFLGLVDFVPAAESVDAAVSPEGALVDLAFFELAEAVEPVAESLSDELDLAFFDFDDVDLVEASLESVELASVDFFCDLVVFFAGVVLESLESVACAFTGAALASANPSPVEIRNANRYFFNRFMLFLPSLRGLCRDVPGRISTGAFAPCPAGVQPSVLRVGRLSSTHGSQESPRFCPDSFLAACW
jgi:hypothetical protein